MMEMELISAISNVGFPIAVTAYLLLRFEKIIQANTIATIDLHALITQRVKR